MSKKINFNKKIIFLAYREWAKNTINQLIKKIDFKSYYFFNNQRKFEKFIRNKKDFLIILIGWSNILNPKIVRDNICMGIHPSDLPNFKGGSPIQNQILKNVINTKSTLFKLNNKIDDGNIYGKVKLNLSGNNFFEISKNLEKSSYKLIFNYLMKYPNNKQKAINTKGKKTYKRLLPKESKIELEDFLKMNTMKLYNKIRCLTYPYPNAYLQNKNGDKLYFLEVSYKKK